MLLAQRTARLLIGHSVRIGATKNGSLKGFQRLSGFGSKIAVDLAAMEAQVVKTRLNSRNDCRVFALVMYRIEVSNIKGPKKPKPIEANLSGFDSDWNFLLE
jgi:hypothetical protein